MKGSSLSESKNAKEKQYELLRYQKLLIPNSRIILFNFRDTRL